MKKYILLLLALPILFCTCKKEEKEEEEEEEKNKAPTCLITSPNNGDEFEQGATITISVNADDTDGNVTEVRFEIDNIGVSSASNYPYNYEWNTTDEETGSHIIKVIAKDNEGSSTDDEITIILKEITIGMVTDYDGNIYNTIKIGTQWWMAENLKTTHYADGTEIALVELSSNWAALGDTGKAYCYNDNLSINGEIYGALYSWPAAMNGANNSDSNPSGVQGVCPIGWHLPSKPEWMELIIYLSIDFPQHNLAGGKMKETGTTHWKSPNAATNESGFTALPGGYRYNFGVFYSLSYEASFWSTEGTSESTARRIKLRYSDIEAYNSSVNKGYGCSVRCIKD